MLGQNRDPMIINKSSNDITLLNAQVFSRTVGSAVALTQCDKIFASASMVTYDCKNAIEQRFRMPLIQVRAYVQAVTNHQTGQMEAVEGHETPLILIRLVARLSAFRTSDSMGFYVTNPKGILYFDKKSVRIEKSVVLKDGSLGVPITFLALFPRSTPDQDRQTRSLGFKPFIDFHRPNEGRIFRNWDLEPSEGYDNYLLLMGYAQPLRDILTIDRLQDVLQFPRAPSVRPIK